MANSITQPISSSLWSVVAAFSRKGTPPPIKNLEEVEKNTKVDHFWNIHTVIGPELARVKTAYQSRKYLEWRFSVYPLFREFMGLWGKHDGHVLLDYGCGPGNDLVGFLENTTAKKVIGIDISEKALRFASKRIALHNIDNERVELIRISDKSTEIPLTSNMIDYVYCEGVLHHTSVPENILKEFCRVLKPGGDACIMVYNNDSIWFHLYVAYDLMIMEKQFQGLNVYQAFEKTTDTSDCPLARCYRPQQFISICNQAGFKAEYLGGYFSQMELDLFNKLAKAALSDDRLAEEHQQFIRSLTIDERGYPLFEGKHAGIGGVYRLKKPG